MSDDGGRGKLRKKLHMDVMGCFSYATSPSGVLPLKDPLRVGQTARNYQNLCPREPRKKSSRHFRNTGKTPLISSQLNSGAQCMVGVMNQAESEDSADMLLFAACDEDDDFMLDCEKYTSPRNPSASTANFGFKRVSDMPLSSFGPSSSTNSFPTCSPKKVIRRQKRTRRQTNNLMNYFSLTKIPRKSCISANDCSSESNDIEVVYESIRETSSDSSLSSLSDDKATTLGDPYGLLGTGSMTSKECCTQFSNLPDEILEHIFCQIPLTDLLLKYNRVCTRWNDVIRNKSFIPWKKRYFSLKLGDKDAMDHIKQICTDYSMITVENCFLGLIKFVKDGFNCKPSRDMTPCLRLHAKYKQAKELVNERNPRCPTTEPSPWSIIAALVILASSTWDIERIIRLAEYHRYLCHLPDVLECLYCIATFLLHFKDSFGINHGFHYRTYYVLYLHENRSLSYLEDLSALNQVESGQQNIMKYGIMDSPLQFTHEQMRIINHKLDKEQVVKIVAFAGTGKTTTLLQFTKMRPGLKFLNLMYNKSVRDHAAKLFPSNVECRTAHSLAYAAVGYQYRSKLRAKIRALDVQMLIQYRDNRDRLSATKYASMVLKTIDAFVASDDGEITLCHVPMMTNDGETYISGNQRSCILEDAKAVWKKMADYNDRSMSVTHDAYLKLYQLTKPNLSQYDCILVDEGQDCSRAVLDIVLSQSCPKIIVGDPHQQIYSFRGATNALNRVAATHSYSLTQSFRFGPSIAYVANCALEVLKHVKEKTLVGGRQAGIVTGQREGQLAIIARSNMVLFNEAVRMCCQQSSTSGNEDRFNYLQLPPNFRGAFAGGIAGYNFDQLVDIYTLLSGGDKSSIKDNFISRFKSFAHLSSYAANAEDVDIRERIKLVLIHREHIVNHVKRIKERCSNPCSAAHVVFTTVHKAKGLEFDTVRVMDDFSVGWVPPRPLVYETHPEDEFNLLYVAITRAKKSLVMSHTIYYLMLWADEKFEYLKSTSETCQELCARCQKMFTPAVSLILCQLPLTLADGRKIEGGPLCAHCSSRTFFVPPYPHPETPMQYMGQERHIVDCMHMSLSKLINPLAEMDCITAKNNATHV